MTRTISVRRRDELHRSQESITARDSFYITRLLRTIIQYLPNLEHRVAKAMLVVINRFFRPELCPEFFISNNIAIAFSDGSEHTKGLAPQLHFDSIFRQFLGIQVHFEDVEAKGTRPLRRV